ncbi:oligopeptide transporter 2 [[Candida] jaroonii]|uniref:Oligopeptide transporter 2 n=1 Tax=[Candida] jaroonii TaxID=467808 RepID=A0ACA9Y505_9ASCO|nr:oligopeptide transporter 2 [[Candida] jaroonii]
MDARSHKLTGITSQDQHLDVGDIGTGVDLTAITSNPVSINQVGSELNSEQKFYVLKRLGHADLLTLDDLPIGLAFMIQKIQDISHDQAIDILKQALVDHDGDVNFPSDVYDLIERLVAAAPEHSNVTQVSEKLESTMEKKEDSDNFGETIAADTSSLEADDGDYFSVMNWSLQTKIEACLIEYHSPYPEVRAVTDCYDDPNLYVETPRVYILGLIWTAIGAFINQFFAERQPSISLPSSVVQLLLYPSGMLMAAIMPKWKFKVWKYTVDLNPGPWNHKEQMLTTIFYSVSAGTPYVSYNIHAQKMKLFYDNEWADFGYQTLLILSNNFLGFGFAGIMRKFTIYPVRALWPSTLPTLALNAALMKPEKKENINGWKVSRYTFFFGVFCFSFLYFWIPDYLFYAVSTFNWMTWIKPDNYNLATITGTNYGLGLNPITSFDWNIINFNGALTVPFYSQLNQYIGSAIGFFCIIGVYWTNKYWSGYLPINSQSLWTNQGELYDVKSIVNSDSLFDREKFMEVGPPYYSAANLVLYGAFFAIYPFAIIYECFMNWKPMWEALKHLGKSLKNFRKSTFDGFNDPHTRMMRKYKEVPDWCFLVVLVIALVLGIICVKVYPAQTPVWGLFFAVGINFCFLIPLTAVYSTTGFQFGLNVLVELIVGYAMPGNGLALNFLKALGYNINGQAQNYISDQKMGHYAKLPPRAMFRCQMLSVFVASFISLGVINFLINNIDGYCTPAQAATQKFTCPGSKTFYNASILWGVIGPKKVFKGIYPLLQYCFLIGALLPIPCILFKKYGPKRMTKYFQPTLIIGGFLIYAPYNLSYYTMGLYFSAFFMQYLRKNYLTWWSKYNYVLSGAMDAGVAFSSVIIFFAVFYHDKSISWWGNNVSYLGVEGGYGQQARLNVSTLEKGYFGLDPTDYP